MRAKRLLSLAMALFLLFTLTVPTFVQALDEEGEEPQAPVNAEDPNGDGREAPPQEPAPEAEGQTRSASPRLLGSGNETELSGGGGCAHLNCTYVPEKAATCVDEGNRAYWRCDSCGKYFADAEHTDEIEEYSWVLPATGVHTYDYENGGVCTVCGVTATFTVVFDANGGSGDMAPQSFQFGVPQALTANGFFGPVSLSGEAAAFLGWATEDTKDCAALDEKLAYSNEESIFVYGDMTLFAIWEDLGGGTGGEEPCYHTSRTEHPAVAPTFEADGHKQYWTCDFCGRYFPGEYDDTEITPEAVIVPVLPLVDAASSAALSASSDGVSFTTDAAFAFSLRDALTPAQAATYGDWNCDCLITFSADMVGASAALAGQLGYGPMGGLLPDQEANLPLSLPDLLQLGDMSVNDLDAGPFLCGVKNFESQNTDVEMTVDLIMWPGDNLTACVVLGSVSCYLEAPAAPVLPNVVIGETGYDTLEQAVKAAAANTAITVNAGVTIGAVQVAAGSTVTVGDVASPSENVSAKQITINNADSIYVVDNGTTSVVVTAVNSEVDGIDAAALVDVTQVLADAATQLNLSDATGTVTLAVNVEPVTDSTIEAVSAILAGGGAAFEVYPVAAFAGAGAYTIPNDDLKGAVFPIVLELGVGFANRSVVLKHYSGGVLTESWSATADANGRVSVSLSSFSILTAEADPGSSSVGEVSVFYSLSLKDSIEINLYLSGISDAPAGGSYKAMYQLEGRDPVWVVLNGSLPANVTRESNGDYRIVVSSAAVKDIAKKVTVDVYYQESGSEDRSVIKDGQPVQVSIQGYCEYAIQHNSQNSDDYRICKALLDYGTAAQVRFGIVGRYEDGANGGAFEQPVIPNGWQGEAPQWYTSDLEPYRSAPHAVVPATMPDWVYNNNVSVSLSLKSRTMLNFYIALSDADSFDLDSAQIAATLGGQSWNRLQVEKHVDPEHRAGESYVKIAVEGISAAKLGEDVGLRVTFQGQSLELTYSPMTYAARAIQANTSVDAPACRALYFYWKAAQAYFAN